MYLPLLQPISKAHFYVSGDVTIDECAAIAPGVILQADSDSRIIIAANVCIGMGAIVHAHQGTIEIESGVNLGAGVLIVGKCKIAANACVGAATTIFNSDIAAEQVVKAGSLIGDPSRLAVDPTPEKETSNGAQAPVISSVEAIAQQTNSPPQTPEPTEAPPAATDPNEGTQIAAELEANSPTIVYSQRHLNRLMLTLFPNGRYFRSSNQNEPSEGGS